MSWFDFDLRYQATISIHVCLLRKTLKTVFFLFVACFVMNERLIPEMILRVPRTVRCKVGQRWLLNSTLALAESWAAAWVTECMADTRKALVLL